MTRRVIRIGNPKARGFRDGEHFNEVIQAVLPLVGGEALEYWADNGGTCAELRRVLQQFQRGQSQEVLDVSCEQVPEDLG